MAVAQGRGLCDEPQPFGMAAGGVRVSRLIAGANHEANLLHARLQNFLDQDLQRGFLCAVAVHQCLERQCALRHSRRRYD